MTMQTGDKVTIKRGKLNGQEGEVKLTNQLTGEVVLELADGTLTLQKLTNIRTPVEATITQDELAAIMMSTAGSDFSDLVHAIDAKYPGFGQKLPRTAVDLDS